MARGNITFSPAGVALMRPASKVWPQIVAYRQFNAINDSFSETLTAADSVGAAATFASSITENLTAADALVAQCAFASALTETLTASDALASIAIYNVPLTETLAAADSLTSQAILSVAISEALTASDSYASAVSGADTNWGGCFVWLSTDGVTYSQVGEVTSSARMGLLTGNLASYGGANPDTTHSFGVDLTESGGDLTGVSATDAADYTTLSVIKDAGGSLEFLAYRDASLTATYHYTLGGQLYRGLYGTTAGAHVVGAQFARLDGNIFKLDLPPQYVGKTLYVKLQSFNVFGLGVQDLSTCTPYTYVVSGTGYGGGTAGVPTTPATPTATIGSSFVSLSWAANPTTDNVDHYDIYRAAGTGASFGSASKVGNSPSNSYSDPSVAASTPYTYFVVAVNAVGSSTASAGVNATTSAGGGGGGVARPTIVQSARLCTSSGAGSVTLGAAPSPGNTLVAIGARWAGSISTAADWTRLIDQGTATSDVGVIFCKTVVAGESATQTFSATVTGWDIVVYEISGASTTAFYDYGAKASLASSTAMAINTGVQSSTCLGLGMFMCQGGTDTFTLSGATSDGSSSDASATNGGGRSLVAFHNSSLVAGAWQPSATITGAKVNGYAYLVLAGVP